MHDVLHGMLLAVPGDPVSSILAVTQKLPAHARHAAHEMV